MDEIPQDVWEAADEAHYAALNAETTRDQVDVIARAILAERRRCVDVVHRTAKDFYGNTDQMYAAAIIASAIEAGA